MWDVQFKCFKWDFFKLYCIYYTYLQMNNQGKWQIKYYEDMCDRYTITNSCLGLCYLEYCMDRFNFKLCFFCIIFTYTVIYSEHLPINGGDFSIHVCCIFMVHFNLREQGRPLQRCALQQIVEQPTGILR